MSTLLQQIGVDRMSRSEMIELAHQLLDLAEEKPPPPVSDEVRAMIRERLQDIKDTPDDHVPWEEVYAAAKARFSQ